MVKLLLGTLLLVAGLAVAIAGITGVGRPAADDIDRQVVAAGQGDQVDSNGNWITLPLVAGLALAAGGVLVGIGMGNFRRPKIVPPDSPEAHEAATTTGNVSGRQ